MNYRHAYHAGNFADVLKHVVLALVIEYLKRKDAPFRVVDTHAGIGRYALTSAQATKTGEWTQGIGRLLGADAEPLPSEVARAMAPYLDVVRAANAPGELAIYPGSPLIARQLMRASDVLVANELHPEDAAALRATLGRDRRIKLLGLDAWTALKSLLPPKERRGVVLIDPPFEEEDELARMVEGLDQSFRRFRTGVYLAWYPIKDPKPIARFHADLASPGWPELLIVELMIRGATIADRLNGCGLIVSNPPYSLATQLATVLPELARRLAIGPGAGYRLDRPASPPAASQERRWRADAPIKR